MTYERGYYSRTDLATIPYGGPFQVEEVESVKTFWRMIVFLAVTSVTIMSIFMVRFTYNFHDKLSQCVYIYTYKHFSIHSQMNFTMSFLVGSHLREDKTSCSLHYLILTVLNTIIFAVVLPVHEFIVYPVIHKYIISTIGRIGVGHVLGHDLFRFDR